MAAFSAIIHFHMADIWFSGEGAPWKFLTYEFKMADNQHYLPR